jgi:hypothetical protein
MMNARRVAAATLLLAASCLGAQNQVRVANARELLQAIGPIRTVLVAPSEYLLSEVAQVSNPAVSWDKAYDGLELVVSGVSNLTLRAPQGATVLASPRYAFTLVFVDCRNLVLEGLAASLVRLLAQGGPGLLPDRAQLRRRPADGGWGFRKHLPAAHGDPME